MRSLCQCLFLCVVLFFYTILASAQTKTADQEKINFLTLADIHFDPYLYCNTKPCPLIEKLRQTDAKNWPALFAVYGSKPSQYKQDTNYALLTSALAAAKKIAEKEKVKFVLVLGDMLGHDYNRHYRAYSTDHTKAGYHAFVRKTLQFLNDEINNAFPFATVFFTVGNNDSYNGDYVSNPRGPFFNDTAALWATLIENKDAQSSFKKQFAFAGYYALDTNVPDLRLIVLNSNLFSNNARGKGVANAAKEQLIWLKNELAKAKANQQKVFIMMHIPLGIDVYQTLRFHFLKLIYLWNPLYSEFFLKTVEQYAPQIAGIFTGHLHVDSLQMLKYASSEIPTTGTPSISPIFGNNPGFKIYTYSETARELIDFVTYYYPLNETKVFGVEYQFNRFSSLCHTCPLVMGMDKLNLIGRFSSYAAFFYKTPVISVKKSWVPYYWCSICSTTSSAPDCDPV